MMLGSRKGAGRQTRAGAVARGVQVYTVFFIWIFKQILFIYLGERERESTSRRGRGRGKMSRKPDVGLDPRTPGS